MARGAEKQAKDTFNQGKGIATTSTNNANSIFAPLLNQYQDEATHPQGFGYDTKAAMNTAVQQSTGGSVAGAVGQGNLMAARTRNKGAFQTANDAAARDAMKVNSNAALGIEGEDARLKEAQRQSGIAGEAGLYDTNLRTALGAMGAENQSTDELTRAGQSGWFQNGLGLINSLAGAYKAYKGGQQ